MTDPKEKPQSTLRVPKPKKSLGLSVERRVPYLRDPHDDLIKPETPPIPQIPPTSEIAPVLQPSPVQETAPVSDTPQPLPVTAPVPEIAPVRQAPAGFTMVTHEVSDIITGTLDVYSQSVLHRLLRLTWGRQAETCTVGLPRLAEACNISVSQARRAVRLLASRELIEIVSHDFSASDQELRGTTYKILLQRAPTRQRGATHLTAPTQLTPNKEGINKKDNKKGALCALCKDLNGFYYVNASDKSKGVAKCTHEIPKD